LLLRFAGPAFAQAQSSSNDFRTVSGIKVNLGPVHDWLKTRKGERPLPHWKEIRIKEIINVGGFYKCTVSIEGEPEKSIIMSNLPEPVKKAFAGIAEKRNALDSARAQAEQDKQNVDAARERFLQNFDSVREAELNDARARSERSSNLLQERSRAYDEAFQTIAADTTVLAMNSGKEYAKMQIWDCGLKSN
jgi:uncharacterized protein YdcH (DUF465 family)